MVTSQALALPDQLGDLCKEGTPTCQGGHEVHLQVRPICVGEGLHEKC